MITNNNGGYYEIGAPYDMSKKMEVLSVFLRLQGGDVDFRTFVGKIQVNAVAEEAKVSIGYAHKVIMEYLVSGSIINPKQSTKELAVTRREYTKIGPEESIYLLALRAEDDRQLLVHYQAKLVRATGVLVGTSTIDAFFKSRFEFKGGLRKAPLVPLDKWKEANILAFHQFLFRLAHLPNHMKYHWIDEKHVVNKDAYDDRVRADPLTGRVRCIFVSGNFRQAYNLIGIIRASGAAPAMHYSIGEDNGTAASFLAYIQHLLTIDWFQAGDVLIMDNAAIHTGAEATIVADLLWREKSVLVVPLPTRSPELNPIELVFHILARRLRSYRYQQASVGNMSIPQQVARVVDDISPELVLKCAGKCGY
jgi:hypothetical protein